MTESPERAALACALVDEAAARVVFETLTAADFEDARHAVAYGKLHAVWTRFQGIDTPLAVDALGAVVVADLQGGSFTVARVEDYCHAVKQAACRRARILELRDEIARLEAGGEVPFAEKSDAGMTFSALLDYDTKDDPEALFENGWLRRSGSCMEEGYSGIGKSSIAMQQAATWATGKDFFGIQPKRALRSIIIQAENDTADLAEEAQGVHLGAGLCPPDDMLRIFTRCDLCGEALARYAAALAERYKPDLVWLDNLNSYIGGDTNSPADCSKFLRLQLNPVSQRYGFAWIVLHHGNKPPKEDTGFSDIRAAYFGSGNNELTNWPRAKMLILPLKEGGFEFRCTKRGNRAGLLDEAGNRTDRIALQWSKSHICWERAESQALPATNQGRIRELVENIIETSFEPGTAYKSKDLVGFVNKATGRHRSTILSQGTEANSVYNALRERTKHPQLPSTFIVQSPIQSKTVQLDA